MEPKELEEINLNAKMAEHEPDVLLERFSKLSEACQAIADAHLDSLPEGYILPDYFDNAVSYAANLLYKTGSPIFHSDDIKRTVENQVEWAKLKSNGDWLPDDNEKEAIVEKLIAIGSHLSFEDKEPAYTPHVEGRNHEILDKPGTTYNKFGMIVY